ncbi:hypothetical protein D3C78_1186170 [compost metagenome]
MSSGMTLDDGELMTLAYSIARLNTPSGAPLQRKVWISISVRSTATGRITRNCWNTVCGEPLP